MTNFSGFSPKSIQFFKDIKANNNKEWFEAHKSDFIEQVQEPALEFVVALGTRLQSIAPSIQFDTAKNGSGSLMRIYRDTRFSKDKSPYKHWLGIGFWGGAKKAHHAGVYFGISDEGAGLHIGSHNFAKEFLAEYRQAVDDPKYGKQLTAILKNLATPFTINGEQLKRVPKAYDTEHPRGDLLKYKSLYVSPPTLSGQEIASPNLVETCIRYFEQALPLYDWIYKVGQHA